MPTIAARHISQESASSNVLKVSFTVPIRAAMFALYASVACFAQIAPAADSMPKREAASTLYAQVQSISIHPSEISLKYLSDRQRILVQARLADGSTRDVTELAEIEIQDPQRVSFDAARATPKSAGKTTARVTWQGVSSDLSITVANSEESERPLRFRNDILPVLTRAGSASGNDGFRLSLYGFDPAGDYYRITREMSGRRINLAKPDNCLLVNKATGEVPHTGGARIEAGSEGYRKLVRWMASGAKADPSETPLPTIIEVYPSQAVMSRPEEHQPLIVLARYDDGSMRDVTDLSVFFSNNDAAATVSELGKISGTGPGSAFMMARFDQFTAGTSIVVRSGKEYSKPKFEPTNYIDELTLARWIDLQVVPSELCSDEVFLRRVYLDTIGLLPTDEQRTRFLDEKNPLKREHLVDELVSSDHFLDMWIMKLAEMLQIRRANGLTAKGLSLYDAWLREQVHSGATIDKIVRDLIPASGSTFENPPTSYYQTETTPQLLAENIAQAFLGTRIQCAQCHNHPFDRWTMDDYYGFAAFVSQVGYKQAKDPREITVYNLGEGSLEHPVAGRKVQPKFLGGSYPETKQGADNRVALADWLTSPDNKAFARNLGNVVWAHYMGIGIVEPVDDMRVSNPPTNPELLDTLGRKVVEYKFDVRQLVRDICNSKTYQLATQTNSGNAWDDRNFSHATIRRMRAEVLLDCISQVTSTSDRLAGLPLGGRAIQAPDGASNNYFLETFGRASRNTPCTCEVSTSPTLSQALHLLNGESTSGKISEGKWIEKMAADGKSTSQIVDAIYNACLTRQPTESERADIEQKLRESNDSNADFVDLFWAILNSNEFIFNH
jgi:hypothetical protein